MGFVILNVIKISRETFLGKSFPADAFDAVEYQDQPCIFANCFVDVD